MKAKADRERSLLNEVFTVKFSSFISSITLLAEILRGFWFCFERERENAELQMWGRNKFSVVGI